MLRKLLLSIFAILILDTALYAGGKSSIPASSPVATVEPSPWYLGVGLVWAKLSACNNGCSYEDVTYGAMIRGGYDFNRYFGIEARAVYTFLGEGPFGGTPLAHAGLFLKPQMPIGDRITLYGLVGYGYTKNLGNGARLNYFNEEWGASAGIGTEYRLSKTKSISDSKDKTESNTGDWRLFVDYQRLLLKSGVPDMEILSFGVRRSF